MLLSYNMFICCLLMITTINKPEFADYIPVVETSEVDIINCITSKYTIILLSAIITLFFIRRYFKKVIFSPYHISLRKLKRINKLCRSQQVSPLNAIFCIKEILKFYLSSVLEINICSVNNEELTRLITDNITKIVYENRDDIISILDEIDTVIFADIPIAINDIDDVLNRVCDFIKESQRRKI